ncbi:MAG: glycosyltransferase family 2 protein [Silicimonas sp.]
MALHRRRFSGFDLGGLAALGAVRRTGDVLVGFRGDVTRAAVRAAFGESARLMEAPGITLAALPGEIARGHAQPDEGALLGGRNVLLAVRGRETPEAVRDWLDWHRRFLGADAAVIHSGPDAGEVEALAEEIASSADDMEIILTESDVELTSSSLVLVDLLRRRFLGNARAVACLTIADLVMQDRIGTPFDRVQELKGAVLAMRGTAIFPQRLRRGKPAHHGDHAAVLPGGKARFSGWCVAPGQCPEEAVWGLSHVEGMQLARVPPVAFCRAMGVANPGVPIGRLVRKSDLAETPGLVEMMTGAFRQRPPVAQPGRGALQRARGAATAITVVTAMKNEGPFILDWIAHHRAIGIGRFLVYTNDCADGTERLLDLLADAGVTRRDNPFRDAAGGPQHAALRAADKEPLVRDADWLMTLDVDEFINVRVAGGLVSDLFATLPQAGAFSMPSRLFGNADLHGFDDMPVTRRFHLAAPEFAPRPWQAWAFKTLYRNDGTFGGLGVHRPKGLNPARADALCWVDGTGRPLPRRLWGNGWRMTSDCWGYDLAGVNHYAVRSAESFLVKRERGRVNHVGQDQGVGYWFRMNHNVTEDLSIRRLDDRVAAERGRLAALPGVAAAHEAAVDWHRARIARLRADPDQAALFAEITGPRMEKLSRMTPNFGSGVFYGGPGVIPDEIVARDASERFYFNV